MATLSPRSSSSSSHFARAACIAAGLLMLAVMFASSRTLEARVRRALFAASEPGWMHVIHPDHLRANADGTGAVAVGDAVAVIKDVGPNGNDTVFSTSTARPILRLAGSGRYYLESDGVDDFGRFTDVPVTGTAGRVLGIAANETSPGGTHVLVCPRTGGNGYLGRLSTGWYYRSSTTAISSGITSATVASVIASVRSGVAYLQVDATEFSGTVDSPIAPFGVLFRYDGGGGSLYAKANYYGGVLSIHEPSLQDIALVKRWLALLRAA